MIIRNLNKLSMFLLIMIPFFLVSGPFLPDLSVCIMGLIFIFVSIYKGDFKKIFFKKFTILFLLFYTILILSSLNSINILFSFESSLFYFRFLFFVLCVLYLLETYPNFELIFLKSMSLLFFIICLDATLEVIKGTNILGYSAIPGRLAGLFNDEWVIGSFLVRLFPLMIFLIIRNFNKFNYFYKFFLIMTSIMTIMIIIFSGERTAYLLLLIYLFFITSLLIFKNFKLYKLLLYPIIFLLFLLPKFIDQTSFNRLTDNIDSHTSLNIHENIYLSMYKNAFLMFLDKPILGHGPKFYRISCENYTLDTSYMACNSHPHSTYFQLLSETGFIGTFFIFLIFLYIFLKIFHIFTSKDNLSSSLSNLSITMSLFLTLWPLIPSGSFFNNWLSIVYFLPIGFYLYSLSSSK